MMMDTVSDKVSLVKPDIKYRDEYISFYKEWKGSGEDMVPWVITEEPSDFEKMLRFLSKNENGKREAERWVPNSTFWLVNENGRVLGVVNIRHELTKKLFHSGGHIGYGIRPSERQKGYATKLLELSLIKAKELGINPVLVVCDAHNTASEKTIMNNGGVKDTDYIEADGNKIKRFWITLK
jgi:predicted acetyltransferase